MLRSITRAISRVRMDTPNGFRDPSVPNAADTERLAQWIDNHRLLGTVVQGQLAYRFAYQDAIAVGMGVVEYEPRAGQPPRCKSLLSGFYADWRLSMPVPLEEALDAGWRHLRDALTYSQSNRSRGLTGETLRTVSDQTGPS